MNNQTIPRSLPESRQRDKNMDVVDLLDTYSHYDKDHADLGRSLKHLKKDTLQMKHQNTVLHPPVPQSTIDILLST